MTFNAREIMDAVEGGLRIGGFPIDARNRAVGNIKRMLEILLHESYLACRREQLVEIENIYSDVGCSWDHCGCKKEFMDEIREAEKKIGEEK